MGAGDADVAPRRGETSPRASADEEVEETAVDDVIIMEGSERSRSIRFGSVPHPQLHSFEEAGAFCEEEEDPEAADGSPEEE